LEYFTIVGAERLDEHGRPTEDLQAVRRLLTSSDRELSEESARWEEWEWRDPQNPPGVRVWVEERGNGLSLRLSQDPLGPIGPTEKYEGVRNELLLGLKRQFGGDRVQVE
jgi:hypothetical protein